MVIRGFLGLYLLQDGMVYFKSSGEDNPWTAPIIGGLLGGLFLLLLITGLVKNRKGAGAPRRFSVFAIRRIANSYGLDKSQRKMLEDVFRNDAVTDPLSVIQSTPLLDKHFKRTYQRIENSADDEAVVQQRIALLFSTRNSIEATQNTTATATSTRQIPANMAAMLAVGRETYQIRVINAKGDSILVDSPKNSLGSPVKFPNGSRVSLSFFTKSSKGYSFDSKILGVSETPKGSALKLAHAARVKPLVQRRFRRRQTSTNCNFSLVMVTETKVRRKIVKKMTLDKHRYSGTIMDISIGGCSVRSSANIQPGSRVKIEFAYGNSPSMAALGQILRINRGGMYATIHMKFIKMPRRTQNSINAMVFEYSDD
ncbi:flagellar brake protein [Treponema primitia]|uniref:flagellar brake protein n=1 Tax=Treponema primitia TaxID=88058 RepID=UPI000255574B|nr:PilZ domain-containing protein [Treponema primitia]